MPKVLVEQVIEELKDSSPEVAASRVHLSPDGGDELLAVMDVNDALKAESELAP